jgi:Icc-related predicted phosphoesterase
VLVHAGDISHSGEDAILEDFNKWCGELKSSKVCKEIIVVAGNHDISLDPKLSLNGSVEVEEKILKIFTNCIYLDQNFCTVDGITFYGEPRTPDFFPERWAFNLPRGDKLKEVWAKIPESPSIDVLVTHGPPYKILDLLREDFRREGEDPHVGCKDLKDRVFSMKKLKAHVFGHIHNGYGITKIDDIQFVNASICTEEYNPTNLPIVIEI